MKLIEFICAIWNWDVNGNLGGKYESGATESQRKKILQGGYPQCQKFKRKGQAY